MIRVVIFDFGGVIGKWGNFDVVSGVLHKKYNLSKEELAAIIKKHWAKAKVGQIPSKDFWKNIASELNIDPISLRNDFRAMDELSQDMLNLILELKKEYKVVLLSNHIEDWLEEILDKNDLRNYFDLIVTSYETRMAKPDERLLSLIRDSFNVSYSECLLIDDQKKNTQGADKLGMQTFLYEGKFNSLLEYLRSLKLLK